MLSLAVPFEITFDEVEVEVEDEDEDEDENEDEDEDEDERNTEQSEHRLQQGTIPNVRCHRDQVPTNI